MKAFGSMTAEELHSQTAAGRTVQQKRMFKLENYMHPYYCTQGIKIYLNPDVIQEALKIINQLIIHC